MNNYTVLRLKKYYEFNMFPLYFYSHLMLDYYRTQMILKSLNSVYPFKRLKDFPVERHKTSDTLFILASGSSISTYTSYQWEIIRKHDSLGFNFWPVHDFIPTFYQVEIPQDSLDRAKLLATILNFKKSDYQHIPIILKTSHATLARQNIFFGELISDFLPQIYLSRMIQIPGLSVPTKRRAIQILHRMGYFNSGESLNTVMGWAGSITDLLNIAIHFGYKDVVLCGADLNDSRYFYEVDEKYYIGKGVPVPKNIYDKNSQHTVNTDINLLPNTPGWGKVKLKDTLNILNEVVLKPQKINLYVALKSSALYPDIPNFF